MKPLPLRINNSGLLAFGALFLVFVIFLPAYIYLINYLPLFGDATIHVNISKDILQKGFWNTKSPYPPLYHLVGALLFLLGGESGFKYLTIGGLLLLVYGSFILSRLLTRSTWVALISAILILISPKVIFYSARMYMEIFFSAFFIFTVIFLYSFVRTNKATYLVITAIFAALTAITKQQGLIILLPSVTVFLAVMYINTSRQNNNLDCDNIKKAAKNVSLFMFVALVIIIPSLTWQIRGTRELLPETIFTSQINQAARRLASFTDKPINKSSEIWKKKWESRLTRNFENSGFSKKGSIRAESRHIWPWDVVTSFEKGYSLHSLFWFKWADREYSYSHIFLLLALYTLGVVFWLYKEGKNKINLFFIIFLVFNYITFMRNTDQLRYHLFISSMFSFFIPYGIYSLTSLFGLNKKRKLFVHVLFLIILLTFASSYFWADIEKWKGYKNSQAYSPSKGGIASVIEVSHWIRDNSSPSDVMYAIPGNEFQYYSDRDFIFDARIYFLSQGELIQLFKDMKIKYLVIMDSLIKNDDDWINVVWIPKSFEGKIRSLYPVIYTSSFSDIAVYKLGE